MTAHSKPKIITFGCRLNAFESEVMRGQAGDLGNMVVINTCAVTAEAERQARQAIRRARRQRPDARIIVTGCAAQIDPDAYAALDEVDQVLGNQEKMRLADFALRPEPVQVADIMAVRETAPHLLDGFGDRVRGFVQVQNGCDHRCTFCIIPFGRGPNRSLPQGSVIDAVKRMVDGGVQEIVLTGVDITSYGADLPGTPRLGRLVGRLLAQVPDLPLLRLSSLDPAAIDAELWDLFGDEPRLAPHLHLSVQAGDAMVLKRMKRRHSPDDIREVCETARRLRPDVALGADLIAGFPTETEAMFAAGLNLVRETGLALLHVFPYAERPGTPAARMPAVARSERKRRAAALRSAGADLLSAYMAQFQDRTVQALIEQPGWGRTPHYLKVAVPPELPVGTRARVHVTDVAQDHLVGARI